MKIMTDKQIQITVQALVLTSLVVVAAVLGWGVLDGRLRPGAAQARRGPASAAGQAAGSTGSFSAPGAVDGLVLVSADGGALAVVDPATGEVRAERELSRRVRSVTPTPGGVSVWVTYADSPEIDVFDTTELGHETTVVPPSGAGRTPEYLTFSDTGEVLFVTWAESEVISAYTHRMRELTLRGEYDAAGTQGPVIRNRRASRVFRHDAETGGFAVFFAQNGQRMGTIGVETERSAVSGTVAAGFDADYSHLLVGFGSAADARVIAERDGAAVELSAVRLSSELGAVPLGADTNVLAAVGYDRTQVFLIDAGEQAVITRHAISGPIAGLARRGDGSIALLTETGALYALPAGRSGEPAARSAISLSGLFSEGVGKVAGFSISPQGNFACF